MSASELIPYLEQAAIELHGHYVASEPPESMVLELALTHLVTAVTILREGSLPAPDPGSEETRGDPSIDQQLRDAIPWPPEVADG